MAAPRVSVICIFRNETDFLVEAIESVLAQTFPDFELLVVDDGSLPASTRIARDYARRLPGRVRYLEHPGHENRGMSATRNLGLAHASGEFVAFIDADDVWTPGKLAEQVALMDAHPQAGAVSGAVLRWRSWAGGRDRVVHTGHKSEGISHPPETALALYPLGVAPSPTTATMIRRSVIERIGGFDESFTGMFEDQVMFFKLYITTSVYFSSSLWLKYRIHERSCVNTAMREGMYPQYRDLYFTWLEWYVDGRDFPGKDRVTRAIRRARGRSEHLLRGRLPTLPQRLMLRLHRIGARAMRAATGREWRYPVFAFTRPGVTPASGAGQA